EPGPITLLEAGLERAGCIEHAAQFGIVEVVDIEKVPWDAGRGHGPGSFVTQMLMKSEWTSWRPSNQGIVAPCVPTGSLRLTTRPLKISSLPSGRRKQPTSSVTALPGTHCNQPT